MTSSEIWQKLESDAPTGEKINAKLAFPEISRKLYAGFDSSKRRHFLIPLSDNEEECQDLQSKGLSIITRNLVVKGTMPCKYIDLLCHDSSGHIIFDAIGMEIAEKIDKGNSKEIILSVVSKWRNFWDKPLRDLLSYNEIVGLFAELWFLGQWMLFKKEALEAVNGWRGPFSSRHDFEWPGKSVEVKATTNIEGRIHRIHGIEQLTPPEQGELFLFSLKLREEQGAENTLASLIFLCKEKIKEDSEALSRFENILAIAGYNPLHDNEYSKYKFRIVDEKLFSVTKEFPKLIKDSFLEGIPSGVSKIEYDINLNGFDHLCIADSPKDEFNL